MLKNRLLSTAGMLCCIALFAGSALAADPVPESTAPAAAPAADTSPPPTLSIAPEVLAPAPAAPAAPAAGESSAPAANATPIVEPGMAAPNAAPSVDNAPLLSIPAEAPALPAATESTPVTAPTGETAPPPPAATAPAPADTAAPATEAPAAAPVAENTTEKAAEPAKNKKADSKAKKNNKAAKDKAAKQKADKAKADKEKAEKAKKEAEKLPPPAPPTPLAAKPTTPPAPQEEKLPGISLESVVLFALDRNPQLMAELEKVRQAGFAVDEARADYYPQVNLVAKAGHEYNDPASLPTRTTLTAPVGAQTDSRDYTVAISQILYNGFATDNEVERRKALERSSSLYARSTLEDKINETVNAYADIWRRQREVAESKQFVARLESIGKKITLMHEAGAESKAKKEYVDSRVAASHSELERTQAMLTNAYSTLEGLTGPMPRFAAQRPEQIDPTLRNLESYYKLADKDNTRLQVNASDRDAVERQIEVERAAYYPTVKLELTGRRAYDVGGPAGEVTNASAMVVMNYQLFDGFLRDNTIDRLKSQKTETELRQRQMMRDLYKDIRKDYNQILSIKQEAVSTEKEILSSESLQSLYQKQFELGEGDIITIIEGYERLHNARMKSFKLESDLVINSHELIQKAGALSKESFCASC